MGQLTKTATARLLPSVRDALARMKASGLAVVVADSPRESETFADLLAKSGCWGLPDYPQAIDVTTLKPAFGVETRGYRKDGKTYLSLMNHTVRPMTVRLENAGIDLLTGEPVPSVVTVKPMVPRFVEYASKGE